MLLQENAGCSGRLLGLLANYFSRHLTLADRAAILQPVASTADHESSDLIGVVEGDHRGEQQHLLTTDCETGVNKWQR